jgi:hypothetical protein
LNTLAAWPLACLYSLVRAGEMGALMENNFDIFKRLRNGKPLWITSVPEIEEARQRVDRLGAIAPGEYLIYSQRKGIIVEYVNS